MKGKSIKKKRGRNYLSKYLLIVLGILTLIELVIVNDLKIWKMFLASSYFGFFFLSLVSIFRKKEDKIEKNYLILILVINIIVLIVNLFIKKNLSLELYFIVINLMELVSVRRLLIKKDYGANKLFLTANVLSLLPDVVSPNFSADFFISLIVKVFVIIYFWNIEKNYFGLFDLNLNKRTYKKFEIIDWLKYICILAAGTIYLFMPFIGGIIAVIVLGMCWTGIFDIYRKIKEAKKFNKKVRLHPDFRISKLIYQYATCRDDYLKKQLEKVAKKDFLEKETPYEVYAIMELINDRKKEVELKLTCRSAGDLQGRLKKLFEVAIRPEILLPLVRGVLYDKFIISVARGKKIDEAFTRLLKNFDERYYGLVDNDMSYDEKIFNVKDCYDVFRKGLISELNEICIKIKDK